MTWLEFVLGSLVTFRLTWLIVYDTIAEPFRDWLEDHADRARDTRRDTRRRRIAAVSWPWAATLLTCPWCLSVWLGAAVAVYIEAGGPTVVLAALAFAAVAGVTANLARALASIADDDS